MTVRMSAREGSVLIAALDAYVQQAEHAGKAEVSEREAHMANELAIRIRQHYRAGERGHYELSWVRES